MGEVEEARYIYDKEIPYLSLEVEDLKKGDLINCLIVMNKLDSKTKPRIVLSLKNSKIMGSKQLHLSNVK